MPRLEQTNLVTIDALRIRNAVDIYFHWKQLDAEVRAISTRGINLPAELSELFGCYVLGYQQNKGSGGDAYDPRTERIIEMKGSGSERDDLSSFSPSEVFDELVFCKIVKNDDCCYIYETGIDSEALKDIQVSSTQTVRDQQAQGRRPRFSVEEKIIRPLGIQPSYKFDLRNKEIIRL